MTKQTFLALIFVLVGCGSHSQTKHTNASDTESTSPSSPQVDTASLTSNYNWTYGPGATPIPPAYWGHVYNRFPGLYYYQSQLQYDDRIRQIAELRLAEAKARLLDAQKRRADAETAAYQSLMQNLEADMRAITSEINALQLRAKEYEVRAESLDKILKGEMGQDTIASIFFFLGLQGTDASQFLSSEGPFGEIKPLKGKANFKAVSYARRNDRGVVENIHHPLKDFDTPDYDLNIFGLIGFLNDTELNLKMGSAAHGYMIKLRQYLAVAGQAYSENLSKQVSQLRSDKLNIWEQVFGANGEEALPEYQLPESE